MRKKLLLEMQEPKVTSVNRTWRGPKSQMPKHFMLKLEKETCVAFQFAAFCILCSGRGYVLACNFLTNNCYNQKKTFCCPYWVNCCRLLAVTAIASCLLCELHCAGPRLVSARVRGRGASASVPPGARRPDTEQRSSGSGTIARQSDGGPPLPSSCPV